MPGGNLPRRISAQKAAGTSGEDRPGFNLFDLSLNFSKWLSGEPDDEILQ
jgi:hypothetical protein